MGKIVLTPCELHLYYLLIVILTILLLASAYPSQYSLLVSGFQLLSSYYL
jgi:hypothetical protein